MNKNITTMLENFFVIIRRKNSLFIILSLVYILITIILKWGLGLEIETFMYALGGFIGMYFMDFAEDFFALKPSPFRSVFFMGGLVMVSFFIVSSSVSFLARGLVLLLYLTLLLWQIGEYRITGHLDSWYQMIPQKVEIRIQKMILGIFILIYCLETWIFIR